MALIVEDALDSIKFTIVNLKQTEPNSFFRNCFFNKAPDSPETVPFPVFTFRSLSFLLLSSASLCQQ